MTKVSQFGKPDSLALGEVLIPLVVLKQNQNVESYAGFIPGFVMKNIVEESAPSCLEKLKKYLMQKLDIMTKQNQEFPFFPTRAEIMADFQNVYSIDFVKVKSAKRSN
ncbi:MAG: hypothetical protein IJ318_01045 [Clostridia bacterium]|nr:hypothetical protein [Clostridia bacterium]